MTETYTEKEWQKNNEMTVFTVKCYKYDKGIFSLPDQFRKTKNRIINYVINIFQGNHYWYNELGTEYWRKGCVEPFLE